MGVSAPAPNDDEHGEDKNAEGWRVLVASELATIWATQPTVVPMAIIAGLAYLTGKFKQ